MLEAIGSLIVATALLLGSPGPVPIALAATGGVFGLRRGVPFLLGILSGLAVTITLGTVGIVALFSAFPTSRFVVGLCDGFILNLLNPKAYAAFVAAIPAVMQNDPTDRVANDSI